MLFQQKIFAIIASLAIFVVIIYLMFIALHFAIKISSLSDQVKNLAQKLSLIEAEKNREK
jgi:hypothetical protein